MTKADLSIPFLEDKFLDLRDTISGDSYNWSWIRPLSDIQYLAIHHTATENAQTPQDIADIHINKNGWGGIGYHFLVDKDGKVFYVGDISTARANVSNMNEKVIGIGLIGNFTEGRVPSAEQLSSTRILCNFLISDLTDLPNVSSWEAVKGHKELPGQATVCPGDTWKDWKQELLSNSKEQMETGEQHNETQESYLKSQVENLQTSLAFVEQKRISLQEALMSKEQDAITLKNEPKKIDDTLTIIQALINLYKFALLPRKVEKIA